MLTRTPWRFSSSLMEQRELLGFVVSGATLEDGRLTVGLRPPLNLIPEAN
jgi:hypothetical protein